VPSRARVPWSAGRWLNEPALAEDGDDLLVTAAHGSDFWRTTSYGFVRDSGHALLGGLDLGSAVEVSFLLDYDGLYDQAGVLVRVTVQQSLLDDEVVKTSIRGFRVLKGPECLEGEEAPEADE